jgi:type II secretion system protein F
MPRYSYKATDESGKIVEGALDATEEKEVVKELHSMDLIPIHISLSKVSSGKLNINVSEQVLSLFKGISSRDLMIFTQDLPSLLEAGLPVDRALAILSDATENEKFAEVLRSILKTIKGGGYLSEAMSKHPKIFSSFYVSMVRAGEAGGVLESVLTRLGEFLETSEELKDYIKSAMVYPLFLVFVGGASIIILMTFVIPKFSMIFSDMGQAIPFTTRVLLGLSGVLSDYWWLILFILAVLIYFVRRYFKSQAGRLGLDQYKLTLPAVGDLVRKIEVARFARTLGTLTQSGVPILQALDLVKDIMTNKIITHSMEKVHERVKEGEKLSKPLNESGVFPSLAIQMITVGEETGKLDSMLLRIAENYEKMVRTTVKRYISFLEPAMILAMGLVVGFVVLSMLMAIFSMNDMPF